MSMKCEVTNEEDAVVLRIDGVLSYDEVIEFDKTINQILEQKPALLVVDLGRLQAIGTPGIGKFISLQRQLQASEGGLRLAAMPDFLASVMKTSKLEELFKTYPSVESALK